MIAYDRLRPFRNGANERQCEDRFARPETSNRLRHVAPTSAAARDDPNLDAGALPFRRDGAAGLLRGALPQLEPMPAVTLVETLAAVRARRARETGLLAALAGPRTNPQLLTGRTNDLLGQLWKLRRHFDGHADVSQGLIVRSTLRSNDANDPNDANRANGASQRSAKPRRPPGGYFAPGLAWRFRIRSISSMVRVHLGDGGVERRRGRHVDARVLQQVDGVLRAARREHLQIGVAPRGLAARFASSRTARASDVEATMLVAYW